MGMSVKRFMRGLLKGVLWTLLVLCLIHTAFNLAGTWKIRAAQQRMVAAGLPMTWAQLLPPPAKDAENAAPILKSAFDVIRPDWANPERVAFPQSMTLEELHTYAQRASNAEARVKSLTIPILSKMDIAQRAAAARLMNTEPYTKALRLLHEAGTLPRADFQPDMIDLNDPYLVPMTQCLKAGKLLYAHARLSAEFGQPAAACTDVVTTLRLANLLKEDPVLISHLIRISLNAMALENLQFTFQTQTNHSIQAGELRLLLKELLRNESGSINMFPTVIDAERLYASSRLERMLDGYLPELRAFCPPGLRGRYRPILAYLISPWLKLCYADYLGQFVDLRPAATPPFYRNKQLVERLCSSNNIPRWDLLTVNLLAAMPDVVDRSTRDLAALQTARLGLTAELYRQAHGQYPDTLDDLAAITPVPVDPFTGRPFVYRREGTGFKLYSLGPNLKDDGGVPRDNDKHHDAYDIVWAMAAPSKPEKTNH
jgi:hypothetical protein